MKRQAFAPREVIRKMSFMNRGALRRNQKILLYVLVFLVVASFLLTIIIPYWY